MQLPKHTDSLQQCSLQERRQNLNRYINKMYSEMMSLDGIKTNDKSINKPKENKHKNNKTTFFSNLKNIFKKWLKRK